MDQERKNFCTIYLVRHGETEDNRSERLLGGTDSPLTAEGVAGIEVTAQELKTVPFDAIFSSDLHRAVRTAELLRLERELAVQTKTALRERSYGRWEGTAVKEYREMFKRLFAEQTDSSESERKRFKISTDVESDEEIAGRFITQLREIAVAYPAKSVLIVSHGGCIRSFLNHIGYASYDELPTYSISNAGYAKILCDGIDFFVIDVKGIPRTNGLHIMDKTGKLR